MLDTLQQLPVLNGKALGVAEKGHCSDQLYAVVLLLYPEDIVRSPKIRAHSKAAEKCGGSGRNSHVDVPAKHEFHGLHGDVTVLLKPLVRDHTLSTVACDTDRLFKFRDNVGAVIDRLTRYERSEHGSPPYSKNVTHYDYNIKAKKMQHRKRFF